MLFAEGQALRVRFAGEEFVGHVDRYYPGAWQAVVGGRWLAPIMIHESDLTTVPEDEEQRQRARVALKRIGYGAGLDWVGTCEHAAEAIGHPLLPEEMDLAQLATAQQAIRDYARRTFGLRATR